MNDKEKILITEYFEETHNVILQEKDLSEIERILEKKNTGDFRIIEKYGKFAIQRKFKVKKGMFFNRRVVDEWHLVEEEGRNAFISTTAPSLSRDVLVCESLQEAHKYIDGFRKGVVIHQCYPEDEE